MARGIVFVGKNQSFYFRDPTDAPFKQFINDRAIAGDTYGAISYLIDQRFVDSATNQRAHQYLNSLVRK